jgi:hypothetical protein
MTDEIGQQQRLARDTILCAREEERAQERERDRRSWRWKMSGATASVVASMPTQSRARCWLSATIVAAPRNASKPVTKTRPPRALSNWEYPTV